MQIKQIINDLPILKQIFNLPYPFLRNSQLPLTFELQILYMLSLV